MRKGPDKTSAPDRIRIERTPTSNHEYFHSEKNLPIIFGKTGYSVTAYHWAKPSANLDNRMRADDISRHAAEK
jgi:hypothetical protein